MGWPSDPARLRAGEGGALRWVVVYRWGMPPQDVDEVRFDALARRLCEAARESSPLSADVVSDGAKSYFQALADEARAWAFSVLDRLSDPDTPPLTCRDAFALADSEVLSIEVGDRVFVRHGGPARFTVRDIGNRVYLVGDDGSQWLREVDDLSRVHGF